MPALLICSPYSSFIQLILDIRVISSRSVVSWGSKVRDSYEGRRNVCSALSIAAHTDRVDYCIQIWISHIGMSVTMKHYCIRYELVTLEWAWLWNITTESRFNKTVVYPKADMKVRTVFSIWHANSILSVHCRSCKSFKTEATKLQIRSVLLRRWYTNITITVLDITCGSLYYLKQRFENWTENIQHEGVYSIQSPKLCVLNKRQDDG
jgi:hypothetical protein